MATESRDPYEILGVPREAPRTLLEKQYRRKVSREHRLLEYDRDAVRRLHELNQAYAAITRPPRVDRSGYLFVVVLVTVLLAGYILDVPRRIFVLAPVIIGLAGLLWLFDTVQRHLRRPKTPPPTAASVRAEASLLLGGPVEEAVVTATRVEPPASGAYLADPLYLGDDDEPADLIPGGTSLPFVRTFVLSVTGEQERVVAIPISTGRQAVETVRIHAHRPMRAGDLLELQVAVGTDGQIRMEARDTYTDAFLRVESASPLLAPVAVAGYRA